MSERIQIIEAPDGELLINGQPADFCQAWRTEDAIRQCLADLAERDATLAFEAKNLDHCGKINGELRKEIAERDARIATLEAAMRRQSNAVKMLDMSHVARAETIVSKIPPMTDPLGQFWAQPRAHEIEIDATHALMSRRVFERLAEYSTTMPGGVYPGKMWRACFNGEWWLRWYGVVENDPYRCSNNQRRILIA